MFKPIVWKRPCLLISALLLGLLAGWAGNSWAATYQVGPTRPWQTLQAVAGLLNPGDIVEVDGNHTYSGDVVFNRSGSAAAPIHIRGMRVNGQRPVISGGVNAVAFTTPWPYNVSEGGHHYILEGFEITGATNRGIYHQARNLIVRDCRITYSRNGILGADQGSGSLLLEYTEIAHCGEGGSAHQIYVATDEVNNPGSVFRMQHCYIHSGHGGNNVKSRAERNEIYYNWIEGAYYHELELIGPDEYSGSDGGNPLLVREDSDVVGNVLFKKATAADNNPDFYVIRIGGDGTGESRGRYRFVNNTIIAGTGDVFRMFHALEAVEIHNNVFHNPSGSLAIHRTVEANWVTGQAIITGNHNWIQSGAQRVPPQLNATLNGNSPGFTDLSRNNLTPTASSPLIHAGHLPTQSPAGFEFPNPLPAPLRLPPSGTIETPGTAANRVWTDTIAIGAFESSSAGEPVPQAGSVLHVDARNEAVQQEGSPQYPYRSLQAAIDQAVSGNLIKVARGNYSQVDTRGKALTISGGYAGAASAAYSSGQGGDFSQNPLNPSATIISGGLDQTGVTFTRFDDQAYYGVLENLTVSQSRKGIVCDTESSWPHPNNLTIRNTIVENNGQAGETNPISGAGIILCGGDHTVENSIIRNNRGGWGAGLLSRGGTGTLRLENNRIENNVCYVDSCHGAGLTLFSGTKILTGNVITGNRIDYGYGWGGGVFTTGPGVTTFSRNTIRDNYAPSYGGGVFIDGATADLTNDLIHHNRAGDYGGAGIAVDDEYGQPSQVHVTNCTIAFNTSTGRLNGGNGIYLDSGSTATITNSVLWGNGDDFYVRSEAGSSLTVNWSLTEEAWAGNGNISGDPLFADPLNGNFHLRSTSGRFQPATGTWVVDPRHSPAIDAGDPAAAFHQEPQPNGGRVNLGAFGNTPWASKSLSALTDREKFDQILSWAESAFPEIFPRVGKQTYAVNGLFYCHYSATNLYVGTSAGRLLYYDPASGAGLQDLGTLDEWLVIARGSGLQVKSGPVTTPAPPGA